MFFLKYFIFGIFLQISLTHIFFSHNFTAAVSEENTDIEIYDKISSSAMNVKDWLLVFFFFPDCQV